VDGKSETNIYDFAFRDGMNWDFIAKEEALYRVVITQFTGLLDKNGKEIYESDILRFSDKWEWYRASGATAKEIEKLPFEERVITIPENYEWLLSSEIQTYWEVIGNIYENEDLLEELK